MKPCTEKTLLMVLLAMLFCGTVFAQEAENVGQIVLPDVSSTIDHTEITIDPDAIPDFSLVLPLERPGLPVIRQLEVSDAVFDSFTLASDAQTGKDIFMEASLGIGFRSSFAGDFSVYRSTGTIPFTLSFIHETVNGFGTHMASEGFSSSETEISGDGSYYLTDLLHFSAAASYSSGSYGLQGNSSDYYNMNHETGLVTGQVRYQITPAVTISGGLDLLFNSQFAALVPGAGDAAKAASRNGGVWIDPSAGFTVSGKNWSAGITAQYSAGSAQSRTGALASFSGVWGNLVETDVTAGIVIATNCTTQTVYPFTIRVASASSVPFSLSAEGGLKSGKTDLVQLQSDYPYLFSGSRQYEESAWYGQLRFQRAVKEYGFVTAGADIEKTAFGNGRLLPAETAGSLTLAPQDVTVFDTSVGVAVPFDLLAFSVDWNVSWLDTVGPRPANALGAGVSFTSESGLFGGETSVTAALADAVMPFWNLSGLYRVSSAVKLEISGNDLLCLFQDRSIGNGYISRGGAVTISAHVYF